MKLLSQNFIRIGRLTHGPKETAQNYLMRALELKQKVMVRSDERGSKGQAPVIKEMFMDSLLDKLDIDNVVKSHTEEVLPHIIETTCHLACTAKFVDNQEWATDYGTSADMFEEETTSDFHRCYK